MTPDCFDYPTPEERGEEGRVIDKLKEDIVFDRMAILDFWEYAERGQRVETCFKLFDGYHQEEGPGEGYLIMGLN